MNTRRQDLLTGLFTALSLHSVLFAWTNGFAMPRPEFDMVPAFRIGDSALRLTLGVDASPEPTPPVQVPPEELLTEPPGPEEPIPLPEPEKAPEVQPRPDADTLDKGAESAPSPESGIAPVYPLGSRLRGEEGTVVLGADVAADGHPTRVVVEKSSGFSALDNAARRALERTRFVPAHRGGMPHAETTSVAVTFRLRD